MLHISGRKHRKTLKLSEGEVFLIKFSNRGVHIRRGEFMYHIPFGG